MCQTGISFLQFALLSQISTFLSLPNCLLLTTHNVYLDKPAAVLVDTVPKTATPTLAAFNKDVRCFWVTSSNHIAYTTTKKSLRDTLKTIRSINTPHKSKPVGKAAQPLVAASVVGSEMHVVFTATDSARPNNICLRHMAFSPTQTHGVTWNTLMPLASLEI